MPPPPYNSKDFRHFQLGFTLAETLITLAIIGIIAALTVPTLMKNYQRGVLETSFRRGYNLMKNGAAQMIMDNNPAIHSPTTATGVNVALEHAKELARYISGFHKHLGLRDFDHKLYNSTPAQLGCSRQTVQLKNGMTLFVSSGCYIEGRTYYIIDINGVNKKPNRWGYDWWAYEIDSTKKILQPAGMSGAHYGHEVPYKCGTKGRSKFNVDYGCTYYALINKCPDDETKSYWECLKL